jgi:predicted oxidoreductase
VLLLHRPDALVEPEEVAEAFTILQTAAKSGHFGVSNQNPMQIELLTKVRQAAAHLQPASVQHHQHRHDRRGDQREHGNRPVD